MVSVPAERNAWKYVVVPGLATWALVPAFAACVHGQLSLSRVSFPGLRYLGELTYAIYLIHSVLPHDWLVHGTGLAGSLQRFGLALALSVLLHHLIERPALALRNRILSSFRPAAPVVEARGSAREQNLDA
jgi:peptidoglycan/LPS O-acetylase OafA/YrhL